MKKNLRVLICLLSVLAMVFSMSFAIFADGKQGWHTDADGKERYYENGNYVTGIHTIGGIPFEFGSDGESLGVYDGYKAPGTTGTMDTSEYTSEVAKKQVLYFCDYNAGSSFNGKVAIKGLVSTSSLQHPNKTRPYQNVVLKHSKAEFLSKGTGSNSDNLAMRVFNSTKTELSSGLDSYIDFNFEPNKNDIVFEAEYKLGDDINLSNTITLLNSADRSSFSSTLFISLLRLNQEGYVIAAASDELLCKLSKTEFTRISVAVKRATNTYDVYVNGVLVKADIPFYTAGSVDHKKIALEQFRTFQFNGSKAKQGSFYIDNAYVYEASKPVCTQVDPAPKNGVCVDGGYLRYYKNNIILTGKKTVNGTFLGVTLVDAYLNFNSLTGRASIGAEVKVVVDGKVTNTYLADNNTLTAPAAVELNGKRFVGWKVTDASGNSQFMRVGEQLRISSSVTCEAVGVGFDILDGASVKVTSGGGALRYIAKISKPDLDSLAAMGVKVESHMIIVPKEYFDNTFGYNTVEALKKSGYTDISDVTVNEWFEQTENYYYYSAEKSNIPDSDYLKEYAATAYLKLTFADGSTEDIYSDYDAENNSRSVYAVAKLAYNDRITEKGYDGYKNKVKFSGAKTYSPYTKAQLKVIKGYVDKVIALDSDDEGVNAAGMFYDAPFKIKYNGTDTGFDITVSSKDVPNALGVILNGKLLDASKYTIDGESCKLSVESGRVELGTTVEEEDVNSWIMLDAGETDTVFGKPMAYPETAPDGTEKGFLWKFGENKGPILTEGSMGRYKKTKDYVNMSDWQSISFYIYVKEQYKGANFYFIFYSENDSTDGTDYYAKQVKVANAGWNSITLNKSEFNANRSPLGWDKITSVSWPTTGWSMVNDTNTELYVTSIIAYDKESESGSVDYSKIENAAVFSLGGYSSIIYGQKSPINKLDTSAVTFKTDKDVYYVPVNSLAAGVDEEAVYYGSSNKVHFSMEGAKYVFGEGKTYSKNGKNEALINPAKLNGEAVFISVEDAMAIFGFNQKYIDRMGLIALWESENSEPIISYDNDSELILALMQECIYERPTGEQIIEDLNSYSGGQHPYLMLNAKDFEKLSYYKDMDATLQGYLKKLDNSWIEFKEIQSCPQYLQKNGRKTSAQYLKRCYG